MNVVVTGLMDVTLAKNAVAMSSLPEKSHCVIIIFLRLCILGGANAVNEVAYLLANSGVVRQLCGISAVMSRA